MNTALLTHTMAAALGALALTACSSGHDAPETAPDADGRVTLELVLDAGDVASAASRAGATDGAPLELMKEVRIIVVDAGGNVEAVSYETLIPEQGQESTIHRFRVRKEEKKDVYVIANESATAGNISLGGSGGSFGNMISYRFDDRVRVGSPFPREDVEGIMMGLGKDEEIRHRLPMSAKYSVYVSSDNLRRTFALHRAAVRYDVEIVNNTGSQMPLRVDAVSLTRQLGAQSLFPRVERRADGKPMAQCFSYDASGILTEDATGAAPSQQVDGSYTEYYESNLVNPAGAPETTFVKPLALTVANGGSVTVPPFYLLEGLPLQASAPYAVGITVNGAEYSLTKPLDKVKALPRNTRVVIRITLGAAGIECIVEAIPYTGVKLDPIFGITPK